MVNGVKVEVYAVKRKLFEIFIIQNNIRVNGEKLEQVIKYLSL